MAFPSASDAPTTHNLPYPSHAHGTAFPAPPCPEKCSERLAYGVPHNIVYNNYSTVSTNRIKSVSKARVHTMRMRI